MSFMQMQIYRKGRVYAADCGKCGATHYIHEWTTDDFNGERDAMQDGTLRCSECAGTMDADTFQDCGRQYAGCIVHRAIWTGPICPTAQTFASSSANCARCTATQNERHRNLRAHAKAPHAKADAIAALLWPAGLPSPTMEQKMRQYRNLDAPSRPQQVSIIWTMETLPDDSGDAPDERQDGFWPSHDPKAAGYCPPERFDASQQEAEETMAAWRAGEWYYCGVVAVADISIPIGQGSFVLHQLRSAGLWGIESNAGDYLKEVFEEQKAELLDQIKALGAAIVSDSFTQSTS